MNAPAFRWRKLGLVFCPSGESTWLHSHAQNPTALLYQDRIRVFFNCRPKPDANGQSLSHPTFIDLDIDDPRRVLTFPASPVLELGGLGAFDEFGVMAGSLVRHGPQDVWMYYVGWMRTQGAPYQHAIGIATSSDGGSRFEKMGSGPALTRTLREPFLQNSPFVAKVGDLFHLWYSSGTAWIRYEQKPESIYVLMHATSVDGIEWKREGVPIMPFQVADECQTNPCVLSLNGRFHMWFCYRHGLGFRNAERGYRMGYAWSDDLRTWHRDDASGALQPSASGWDSEMVCYPCVFQVPSGNTYMLYSGNEFGRTGFGIAVLEA